jgi:hypothetical protein
MTLLQTAIKEIVKYNKKKAHQVYKLADGTKVAGASTIAKLGDDPSALINWAWKLGMEGLDYAKVRDNAADIGTLTHWMIECHFNNKIPDLSEFSPSDVDKASNAFIKFLEFWEQEKLTIQNAEAQLVSEKYGYGGTLDAPAIDEHGNYILIDWKGLALDTPIPTPNGWTTMGEMKIGDVVFDQNGLPCNVVAVSPIHHKKCYRLEFDDGANIIADCDHLWLTHGGNKGTSVKVLNTEEIKKTLLSSNKQSQHRIPIARPLFLDAKKLIIHPYLLGAWLGDGTASNGAITKPNKLLWDQLESIGYKISKDNPKGTRTVYEIRGKLEKLGVLNNKHIPQDYMRASIQQRTALLQGILDTDGTWNKKRKQCAYETVDLNMAKQVAELARSLGQRVNLFSGKHKGFGKEITRHRVTFTPTCELVPFKIREWEMRNTALSSRRVIQAVVPVESVPTKCIQVDSPSSLYLCGEHMVTTHNTSKAIYDNYLFQLSAYEQLWNENFPHMKITRRAIIRIGKEEVGDFEVRWLPEMDKYFEVFKAQIALYNAKKKIKS